MTMMRKTLSFGAGMAAIAAAAPAAAQYYPYYPQANLTQIAAQQCTAAVQAQLSRRNSGGLLGAILGNSNHRGRVLGVTRVDPDRRTIEVRGLASSGRNAYGPYGVGAYGALGYQYAPPADLSFRCDVDYRGYVRDVDINRR